MPLWFSAAATTVCTASGICLLRTQHRHRGFLAAGLLLLLVGVAFALYTVAAILFVGTID